MSIEKPIQFLLPEDLAKQIAGQAKARRLSSNLSRKTLSLQSGIPESTIRKFETTGMVNLTTLLQIADTLGCMDAFSGLFPVKSAITLDEFLTPSRKRGRR